MSELLIQTKLESTRNNLFHGNQQEQKGNFPNGNVDAAIGWMVDIRLFSETLGALSDQPDQFFFLFLFTKK